MVLKIMTKINKVFWNDPVVITRIAKTTLIKLNKVKIFDLIIVLILLEYLILTLLVRPLF